MPRLSHFCRAVERLLRHYPDKAEEIRRVLGYWLHELRERFRRENVTAAGFELEAAGGWLPGRFLASYDLYRYAEYGFNRRQCYAKWLDYMCDDDEEAYEYWLGLLEQMRHAMAWLGLAPPVSLEQWAQERQPAKPKPTPKPIARPKTIIEWLMVKSRG